MAVQTGDTQSRILAFIERFTQANGYPPSVREICVGTGLKSTSTVHGHLLRLEKKGLLSRGSMKMRAISVSQEPDEDEKTVSVPLVGKVAAGTPILAVENIEEYIDLPRSMVTSGEHFMLEVSGESMIECGIIDGDYIVVRKQNVANDGEIVVAMIDDSATVKRFYKENNCFRLQPENSSMQPIYTRDLTILGKVVSLYRRF